MAQFPGEEQLQKKQQEVLNTSFHSSMDSSSDGGNLSFLDNLIQNDRERKERINDLEKKSEEKDDDPEAHYKLNRLILSEEDKKKDIEDARKQEREEFRNENPELDHYVNATITPIVYNPKNKRVKQKNNPALKAVQDLPVLMPREVPAEITRDEVNEAASEYFRIKKYAYEMRRKAHKATGAFNFNERWSDLSFNQRCKRKKKGAVKKVLRDRAMTFATQRKEQQDVLQGPDALPEIIPPLTENGIEQFLAIQLDQFHLNNDQEFVDNLAANYALTDQAVQMEKMLEQVVAGEVQLEPERMNQVTKQVELLKSIKEWMDARLALIQDPYYVLLSSKELTDSSEVLEGLEWAQGKYRIDDSEHREQEQNIRQFLQRVKAVKDCAFNRSRFRDQTDAYYREELLEDAGEKAAEKREAIARRKQLREEKVTRERWQTTARNIFSERKEAKPFVRQPQATLELFHAKRKEFMKIDLAEFHFNSIEELLQHHAAHDALFAQAKEMQWILMDVSQDERNKIDTKDLIALRVRLALFTDLRCRQAKAFRALTTKDGEMAQMTLQEWIKTHDLVLEIDPKIEEQRLLDEYTADHDQADNLFRAVYDQLKPGQEMPPAKVEEARNHYQRNMIFWETMKQSKMELTAQDEETKAFLNTYFRNDPNGVPVLSQSLMCYLRGKSKEETETILEKREGTPEEQMQLQKEIADYALSEVKHLEGFRVNTGNPAAFLKDFAAKLHQSEVISTAGEALAAIEKLHQENPDAALPEGYDEEYKKELQAITAFAKDHIDQRMATMTGMADRVETKYLGVMDIREFTEMKDDRKAILKDLKKPADEQHRADKHAAEMFFAAADQLIKNKDEIGQIKRGQMQKVASADAKVDAIYQNYRLAYGVQSKMNEFEEEKRKVYDGIEAINESPLFSSKKDIEVLRERCINALSEYEPDVPEYLYYNLSTTVLKELAQKKLKENVSADEIRSAITLHEKAGLEREKEEIQLEWGEKESNALNLMGDFAGIDLQGEEGAENLLTLLDSHAEVLADMASVKASGPKKTVEERKRYLELKRKKETGESLDVILKEEEASIQEFQTRIMTATEDEKADKKYMAYLESQLKMHQKQADAIKEQKSDWDVHQKDYEKELKNLSHLDTWDQEIAAKEKELASNHEAYAKLMEETEYIPDMVVDLQLHNHFKKMEKIEKARAEAEKDQDQVKVDQYDAELEEVAKQIQDLENSKKEKRKEADKEKEHRLAQAEELKKTIQKQEEELEKLKEDPAVPLHVFESLGRRMDGSDKVLAKEIGEHLSGVVDYLMEQSGEKNIKLKNVRKLLKDKDPKLMALLAEANGKIRASMDKAYQQVVDEIKQVSTHMFEDLNKTFKPYWNEIQLISNEEFEKTEAYYHHAYDQADRESDQKKTAQIERETNQSLAELQKLKKPEEIQAQNEEIMRRKKEQMSYVGPEALFMRQASDLFKFRINEPKEEEEYTLEALYHKNWAHDSDAKEQPGEGAFVRNVMQNYFTKVSGQDQKTMMATMLRNLKPMIHDHKHVKTNTLKQTGMHLAGLLRGAGPLMQKMMQGVPARYLMKELSDAVEDMKSKLEPIPDTEIDRMFEQMKKDSNGQITEIKKLQSLGAASVGQALLCRVYGKNYPEGKQVVIKLLRPNIEKRIDREEEIMKDCAKETSEGMLATYEGQLTKVREELDLRTEAQNCKDGVKAYENEEKEIPGVCKSVHVMEEIPPTKDYLVLDKAEGDTVDRYLNQIAKNREVSRKPFYRIKTDPKTKQKYTTQEFLLTSENIGKIPEIRHSLVKDLQSITKRREHLEKVTDMWIRESIFGNGFYHGDMHAGNLMVNDKQATILDYGNSTKLSEEEVKGILALSAAAMYGDARAFLDRFLERLPKEQLDKLTGKDLKDPQQAFEQLKAFTKRKNRLRKKLYDIFQRGDESQTGDKMELALMELEKDGFQIPISIYSYVQSQVRLNNTLRELNDQEAGLRMDIKMLDHIKADQTVVCVDFMLQAQMGAKGSQDQETYYSEMLQAMEEPSEEEFVSMLLDTEKDKDGKTAFEKKHMGMFDKVNKIMSGKATYAANPDLPIYGEEEDEEDEENPIPIPKFDDTVIAEWRTDYENYLVLWEQDQKLHDKVYGEIHKGIRDILETDDYLKSKIHNDCEDAKLKLEAKMCSVFRLPNYGSNGLMEPFGDHYEIGATVSDALLGDRTAFEDYVGLIVNTVRPYTELAKDLRSFIDKKRTGDDAKKAARGLFRRYKAIHAVMAERNKALTDIRDMISYDRRNKEEKEKVDTFDKEKIGEFDTTQFREVFPEWQKLNERVAKKEQLTPEEEQRYLKLGRDMVESRHVGVVQKRMKERCQAIDNQLRYWFMDKEDGKDLYNAYQEFVKLREQDMENRDKNWADDSVLQQRVEAEKKFISIYRKIAYRRLKVHMKAYKLKVPEQKNKTLRDFNTIFEDIVKEGGFFAMTKKLKLGNAIGMEKAMKYNSGSYKGGLDLEDTIPKKPGDEPEPIILKEAPNNIIQDDSEDNIIRT